MHDPVRGFLAEVLRSFDRRFPAYVEEHDLLADILNDPDNTTAIVLKEFGRALVGLTLRELRALPGLGLHMLTATGRLLVRWLSLVLVGLALIVTVMVTIPLAQLLRGGRICLEVPLPWIARAPGPLLSAPALAGPHRIYLPGAAVARLAPLPRESAGTRPAAPWPTGAAVAPTGTAARPTATPTLARRWDAPAQPTATALALGLAPTAAPSVTPVATELPASATPTPWPTPGMPAAAPPDLPAAPSPTFAPSPTLAPISAPSPAAPPERLPTPTATSTPTPTATSTPTATPTTTATSTPTTTATSTPTATATSTPTATATSTPTATATSTPTAAATSTPTPEGARCLAEPLPLDLVLVLDRSTSILDQGVDGQVRDAAAAFLAGDSAEGDRVGLVSFSGAARIHSPLTEDAQAVAAHLAGIRAQGSTDIAAGLRASYGLFAAASRPEAASVLVLLSDGVNNPDAGTRAGADAEARAVAAELRAAGVRVLAVHVGDHDGLALLGELTASSADLYPVPDGGSLDEAFATITASLDCDASAPPPGP